MIKPAVPPNLALSDSTKSPTEKPKKRKHHTQLKPRSAGCAFHSGKCKKADYCEFANAHSIQSIRSLLSEDHPGLQEEEQPKQTSRKSFFGATKHFKQMIQKQMKSDQIPFLPVAAQRTSEGHDYRQIIISDPCGIGLKNPSTFNVNKVMTTMTSAAPKGMQKSISTKTKPSTADHRIPPEEVESHDSIPHTMPEGLDDHSEKEKTVLRLEGIETPKRFIEAPIPLSPMKVSLDNFGLTQETSEGSEWLEHQTPRHALERIASPQTSLGRLDDQSKAKDFALKDGNFFQRAKAHRRKSRSPEKIGRSPAKKEEKDNAVAGMSHKYPAFPNFRQRVEDIRVSQSQHQGQDTSSQPKAVPKSPLLNPTSFTADPQQSASGLKASPIIGENSKPLSVISTESAAEDVQSDTSSAVISNAQSAVRMHVQIATGHLNGLISSNPPPPMPGPAPTRALPSLPEGHDTGNSATPRAGEMSSRIVSEGSTPVKANNLVKPPKRQEYRFLPSDCSPPKAQRVASPVLTPAAAETAPAVSPPPSPNRIKRQGIAISRPDSLPKKISVASLDQMQKQRNERTAARKARDLARMTSQKASLAGTETGSSRMSNGVEHHEGIIILPDIRDSYTSTAFPTKPKHDSSQASDTSLSTTTGNRESSTSSQKISPIIVVAEQKPMPPISRGPSQKSQIDNRSSINADRPQSLKANGYYPQHPSQPRTASLELPEEDVNRARPVSAHSMPNNIRPVAARTPTPLTHTLLRAQSTRSSRRSSGQESQQIKDLELRLSAIEKQNIKLQKAFLAVINASPGFDNIEDVDGAQTDFGEYGVEEAGGRLGSNGMVNGGNGRNGDRLSETGSLYAGLENLLAVHASEAGQRLSTASGP